MTSRWVRVASLSDCPLGVGSEWVVGDRIVALFRLEEGVFALDGICPHQGGPLAQGDVCGAVVTCPWHGWQFDVRNGQHQANPSLHHTRLPVRVEDGVVFVDLGE